MKLRAVIQGRTVRDLVAEFLRQGLGLSAPLSAPVLPAVLFDTNIWIAAVFTTHPCHALAQQALRQATPGEPAVFCRATQQSFCAW